MTAAALLAVLVLTTTPAWALDPVLEPYREAQRAGDLGTVAGLVVAEPRTLRTTGVPFTGTTVALLPLSEAVLARLEQLRARSRESTAAFAAAAPAIRQARDDYERQLWEAGAPDLTARVVVDATGAFRLDDVPAGAWMVIAWHGVPVEVSGGKIKQKERTLYRTQPRIQGFQSVTIWLRTVVVTRGETVTLELTDRNAWFHGVVEERVLETR